MFTTAVSFFLFRVGLFDIIFEFKMFLLYLHDVEWFMTYVKYCHFQREIKQISQHTSGPCF